MNWLKRVGKKAESMTKPFSSGKEEGSFNETSKRKNPLLTYAGQVGNAITQNIIHLLFALLLNILLLYLSKMMWHIYTSTPVGKRYTNAFVEMSQSIFYILDQNPAVLSIKLITTAFIICFTIGSISRVFHISRYFYESRGFFGKLIFWGFPLTFITATFVMPLYNINLSELAYMLSFLPTLFVFMGCFNLSIALFPEIGFFLNKITFVNFKKNESNKPMPSLWANKPMLILLITGILGTLTLAKLSYKIIPSTRMSVPVVKIALENEQNRFDEGEVVFLTGMGEDEIDGKLSKNSLKWISDRDGEIGVGHHFNVGKLSAGSHQITLVGMNSYGRKAYDTIVVSINPKDMADEDITPESEQSEEGSYVDNKNGIIDDTETMLSWQISADGNKRTWKKACEYCEKLGFEDFDDWRVPTLNELKKISNIGMDASLILAQPFEYRAGYYWSTTKSAYKGKKSNKIYAWTVNYSDDGAGNLKSKAIIGNVRVPLYVVCVRDIH